MGGKEQTKLGGWWGLSAALGLIATSSPPPGGEHDCCQRQGSGDASTAERHRCPPQPLWGPSL